MINLNRLKVLFNNDKALIKKFLILFKNQMPVQLSTLEEMVETEDWEQVSNIAHGIKSQVKYLSLRDMATIAYEIEQRSEYKKGLDKIPNLVQQLKEGIMEVVMQL
jgi:HPt (histidine-containing phosphotransfer) domain-containing protein